MGCSRICAASATLSRKGRSNEGHRLCPRRLSDHCGTQARSGGHDRCLGDFAPVVDDTEPSRRIGSRCHAVDHCRRERLPGGRSGACHPRVDHLGVQRAGQIESLPPRITVNPSRVGPGVLLEGGGALSLVEVPFTRMRPRLESYAPLTGQSSCQLSMHINLGQILSARERPITEKINITEVMSLS